MPFSLSGIIKMEDLDTNFEVLSETDAKYAINETMEDMTLFNIKPVVVIYGSVVERSIGLIHKPKDIDVMVNYGGDSATYYGLMPTEIQYDVDMEMLMNEIYNEPKMLLAVCNIDLEPYFDITKVRSSVSNVCSKAYNKGKKKLIVSTDYNEYLGLKNLYHSMKFPFFAKWKFIDKKYPQEDIDYLNDIYKRIFSTYENSTGTLEERFESVNSWLKPEFNKVMTEFRKNFPKE